MNASDEEEKGGPYVNTARGSIYPSRDLYSIGNNGRSQVWPSRLWRGKSTGSGAQGGFPARGEPGGRRSEKRGDLRVQSVGFGKGRDGRYGSTEPLTNLRWAYPRIQHRYRLGPSRRQVFRSGWICTGGATAGLRSEGMYSGRRAGGLGAGLEGSYKGGPADSQQEVWRWQVLCHCREGSLRF